MEIKERELFEYIKCPIRYQLIHKGNILNDKKTFKNMCYETINSYINASLNDMKADVVSLKKKWDTIAQNGVNDGILTPKKVLDGWGLIYRTYEYIKYNNINFLDVNTTYNLEFPEAKASLTGILPPLIDKGSHIEIFVVCFDKQIPDRLEIDSKLKHTIDAYAIKKMFKKDTVITYYIPSYNDTLITLRNSKDFKKLDNIIYNISKCMQQDIIYPRENFLCNTCAARHLCKSWTGAKEKEV